MNKSLVSIVMPVYNGERYLAQALESCLAQTYRHWELIVVDDCSTDNSPTIIKNFEQRDGRIRSIRNARNLKLPGAFNAGYGAAQGDYYTWLSSDDSFSPNALERAILFLRANPEVDLVYSNFSTIDADGNLLDKIVVKEPEVLAVRNKVGPFRVYHKVVHEILGGYDESLFLAEDYDFMLRAFCSFRLRPINEDLYQFRLHASGLTTTHSKTVPGVRDQVKLKNLPLLRQKSSRLAACCHLSLIDPALVQKDVAKARYHAINALRCSPFHSVRTGFRKLAIAAVGGKS